MTREGTPVDIEQATERSRREAMEFWPAGLRRPPGVQRIGIIGYGFAQVGDLVIPFKNVITTKGDEYYVKKAIVAIAPASASAPTAITGMKLGTSATAASKSGAGAALVTYLSGSNATFDTSFPSVAASAGTDQGWRIGYQCTWAAGTATHAAITECVIVNDAAANATTTAANTISRGLFSTAVPKASDEPLIVTWYHEFLGS